MDAVRKFQPIVFKNLSDRTFSGWMTTDDPDEDGDVIEPKGMDDSYFKNHPALTLYHDDERGIGTCREYTTKAHGVWGKFSIGTHDDGEQALLMVKERILTGLSVESNWSKINKSPPTSKELELYGDGCKRVWHTWPLMGISLVPKPANGKCVVVGKALDRLAKLVKAGRVDVDKATMLGLPTEEPRVKVRVFMQDGAIVRINA